MGVRCRIEVLRAAKNVVVATVVALPFVQSTVAAQQATLVASNALRIYVVNEVDRPVALAEVRMSLGQRIAMGRTDSTGVFRADGLEAGQWHASVRRIGYSEAQIDLHVAEGENAFTVMVDPLAGVLSDVKVVDKKYTSVRIAEFEARRLRGEPNAVVTREQIKKRAPISLSQMLRALPGVQVVDDAGTKIAVASRSTVPGPGGQSVTACPMRISVDGLMRPPLSNLDDVIPADVYGIEVYYGPARLPLQLATFRADKWCGLIAIWTRDK